MSGTPFIPPRFVPVNSSGRPYPGAKRYLYASGTTTLLTVYTNSQLSIPASNPQTANSAGSFDAVYINPTVGTYKCLITNSSGSQLSSDDYLPASFVTSISVGQALYPRTSTEISASITPTFYQYAPGDIRRYGASDGSDSTTAIRNAILSSSEVHIPEGTWIVSSAVALRQGTKIRGASRLRSIIQIDGAIQGFTYTGTIGSTDGGSIQFSDVCLKGSATSSNLVALTSAGQNLFTNVKFWRSGASLVLLSTECHRTAFIGCLFMSWTTAAIYYSGINSIQTVQDCQFNISGADAITPTAAVSTCVYLDTGELITIRGANVNGDASLGNLVRINGVISRLRVTDSYAEALTYSGVKTTTTGKFIGCIVENCNLSTADSISIDLTGGSQLHEGVVVRNVRRPETTAVHVLDPGSTLEFEYYGTDLDGSADHVVGYTGIRSVIKTFAGLVRTEFMARQSIGPFTQENVTASQTAVALTGTRWCAVRDGHLTGMVVISTEARTAGTATFEVYKNTGLSGATGTGTGLTAVLNGTSTIKNANYQLPYADTFESGDELYVVITTDGSWTPTTADVRVFVEVEF